MIAKLFVYLFCCFIGLLIIVPVVFLLLVITNTILGCLECDPASLGAGTQWLLMGIIVLGSMAIGKWVKDN